MNQSTFLGGYQWSKFLHGGSCVRYVMCMDPIFERAYARRLSRLRRRRNWIRYRIEDPEDQPIFEYLADYGYDLPRNESLVPILAERIVESALLSAELRVGDLRSDALVFIIINLENMVILPLFDVLNQRDGRDSRLAESLRLIERDLTRVLLSAQQERGGRRISSGSIIRSSGEMWERLSSNASMVWGDDDG